MKCAKNRGGGVLGGSARAGPGKKRGVPRKIRDRVRAQRPREVPWIWAPASPEVKANPPVGTKSQLFNRLIAQFG